MQSCWRDFQNDLVDQRAGSYLSQIISMAFQRENAVSSLGTTHNATITSPVVAWSLIRHSYAVRVACYVTTASNRVDVLDLTLNNIVSFGFGVNAGLGPSCMTRNSTSVLKQVLRTMQDPADSEFIRTTKKTENRTEWRRLGEGYIQQWIDKA
ncbi:hypothetical protein MSG28_008106 [Choristoneura fumiferana]|uniref:Uncharacterized protein n=1 Tax=Choristoneura fumiferana TaxID=7141 RepID=A0ACC0JA55_CHOFU|nr:hypothetical protein MSG28_008106 [Choristoneura fumiferana]